MIETVITALVGLVVTIISSFVTWYLSRRRYNKEVEAMEINNDEKKFKLYTDIIENNAKMMEQMTELNTSLMLKTFLLDLKILEQQLLINSLQATNKEQGEQIALLEGKIKDLTSAIEGLMTIQK